MSFGKHIFLNLTADEEKKIDNEQKTLTFHKAWTVFKNTVENSTDIMCSEAFDLLQIENRSMDGTPSMIWVYNREERKFVENMLMIMDTKANIPVLELLGRDIRIVTNALASKRNDLYFTPKAIKLYCSQKPRLY